MNCPDNSHDDARAPYNQGAEEGPVMIDCPACEGAGFYLVAQYGTRQLFEDCEECDGTGKVNAH